MDVTKISFPYETDVVSERQFNEHLTLYDGYVKNFNKIEAEQNENKDIRKDANATYSKYRCLKSGETYSLNGIILHELYFQNIGTEGKTPRNKTIDAINYAFENFNNFVNDFTACAKSARGWVVFAYDQRSKSYINFKQDTHDQGSVCLSFPILVLDMYEHAYFLDYGTDKDAYIKAFINSINWDEVEKRMLYLFS